MSQSVRKALSSGEPLHSAIDSTGVQIYGEGAWKVRKHGWTKRRLWRKVHLGVDVSTNLIPTSETTDQNKADSSMVEPLLNQLPEEGKVSTIYGDGAYDKGDLYDLCMDRHIALVAPPKATARDQYYEPGEKRYHKSQSIRNQVVIQGEKDGMDAWKKQSHYHKRSLSETAMFRLKTVFGANLSSRTVPRQITLLGMPKSAVVT